MHPARKIPFRDLRDGLMRAKSEKLVSEQVGSDGLRLYCYSRSCVYDRKWDDITLLARGLVLDVEREAVVATPFQKFFNVGEGTQTVPDLPFETFEKVDGSLIILFHHNGEWRTATKGSLNSEQAQWAARKLAGADLSALKRGATYLLEAVYPENRIVVHYDDEALYLLAGFDEGGAEFSYPDLLDIGVRSGWRVAQRHSYSSVSELIAISGTLPANEEGFVLRFSDGLRLKVKGEEYRRIHALISRCTPLAMWEAMRAGDDMDAIRRDLPEEFWTDFDAITAALRRNVDGVIAETREAADKLAALSDKEVGLGLSGLSDTARKFIFPYRKQGGDLLSGRARESLFREIRPTGNSLDGYTPSYAMNRVMEETI